MIEEAAYLFYLAVACVVGWCNRGLFNSADGFAVGAALTIWELFAMFGSWLLAIWLDNALWVILACNFAATVLPLAVALRKRNREDYRLSGFLGSFVLVFWGVFSTLLAAGIET